MDEDKILSIKRQAVRLAEASDKALVEPKMRDFHIGEMSNAIHALIRATGSDLYTGGVTQ